MIDEPDDTSLDGEVTDNVELSENDDLETLDYYDPDEDQDDVGAQDEDGTDDEADEDDAEPENGEGEDQEADEPQAASDIADDVLVKLPDGSTVKFGDLKESPMLKADHTRKTQEISNLRKDVEADAQRMQRINEAFVSHISELVPAAPDRGLALTDPNAYVAQEAQYKAAMEQVQQLIALGDEPKSVAEAMSKDALARAQVEANTKLIEMFPEAAGGETRAKFFGEVAKAATEIGFSNEELSGNSDPRLFALAHWAQKGMDAEQAKAKAKAKVAKAPPANPRKPGQGVRKPSGNAAAMKQLSKSGSIHDAIKIDFD
jgi:hypothetical protein